MSNFAQITMMNGSELHELLTYHRFFTKTEIKLAAKRKVRLDAVFEARAKHILDLQRAEAEQRRVLASRPPFRTIFQ